MTEYKRIIVVFLIVFLLMGFVPVALASDNVYEDQGLTIEEAVDKALLHSRILRQSDLDIEKAEAQRDSLADAVKFIPLVASGSAQADQAYMALVSADISWAMAKKSRTIEEDRVALSTFKAYIDVLEAQESLRYHQEVFRKVQTEQNFANLKYQNGVICSLEKDTASVQHTGAQKAVSSAEKQLVTAYQELNKLIGNRIDNRPVLSEKPVYNQVVIGDPEGAINRVVENSPAIWLGDQNIDLARLQLSIFDWTKGDNKTYRAAEITKEKSEIGVVEARSGLRQALRKNYSNILALEDAYYTQKEAIKLAEDNLMVKELMNSLGLTTELDIKVAELDLQKARNELDSVVYQHEYLKLIFEKPWAAA